LARATIDASARFGEFVNRSPVTVLAAIGFLTAANAQSDDLSKARQVAGTYELLICKSTCSFSNQRNAFARAVVVLFDQPIARKPYIARQPYAIDPSLKACYLVKRNAKAESYAGIQETGMTSWLLRGHTIQFDLYRSPDARYMVEVERTGDLLVGTGRSWGVGMGAPAPEYTPDRVVGRRVRPPDVSACTPVKQRRG
jgi:hypothetical protein